MRKFEIRRQRGCLLSTYSLSRKPLNLVVPPIKPILAQNIPCRSLGRSDIEKAMVGAKPAWSNPTPPKEKRYQVRTIWCGAKTALVQNKTGTPKKKKKKKDGYYIPISSGRNKSSGTVNRSLFMTKIWSVSTISSGWRIRPFLFLDKSGSMYSWTIGLCFGSILSWIH